MQFNYDRENIPLQNMQSSKDGHPASSLPVVDRRWPKADPSRYLLQLLGVIVSSDYDTEESQILDDYLIQDGQSIYVQGQAVLHMVCAC